jgi:hypothetical protein
MAQETSIEQEIMKLEEEWGEAIRVGDKSFVQKLRAQEFILTNSSGKVVTKAQLESIQHSRGPIPPVKFLTGDLKVQVYPSMAVATGWIRFEEPVRNLEFVFEYRNLVLLPFAILGILVCQLCANSAKHTRTQGY